MAELFSWVYRLLHSKLLGVLVILAMAVLALFGTLIVQMPSGTAHDPALRAEWVESVRPRYGGWTAVLDFLGFFSLWTSPLFLSVTVLLAASIIACTTHRLPQLIRRARHPRTHVSDKFFDHAQYRAEMVLPMSAPEALDHARDTLTGRGYRILPDERDPGTGLYADRFRYGPFGTVLAHASFVIILAAFAISAFTGLERALDIPVGESVEVGGGTGLQVLASSFRDTYDPEGRPLDYVSHLVVSKDGAQAGEADVRVNSPLVVDGIAFHQASFGVAASLEVKDAAGRVRFKGAVPLRWQSQDNRHAIGKVTPDGTSTEIVVVTPASGTVGSSIKPGSAVLEFYDATNGAKLSAAPVDPGGSASAQGLTATFIREQRYTGIIARRDPGAMWMWVGSTLLVLGSIMTFALRHRRLWVRVEEEGNSTLLRLASAEKLDTTFDRHFRALVARIDETAPSSQSSSSPTIEETAHA